MAINCSALLKQHIDHHHNDMMGFQAGPRALMDRNDDLGVGLVQCSRLQKNLHCTAMNTHAIDWRTFADLG